MSLSSGLVIAALAASVLLLVRMQSRAYPIIAVMVSGLEVLIAFRVVRMYVAGVSLMLVLGAALAAVGVVMFMKVSTKNLVAAATLVTVVGAIQVLLALRLFG